MNAALSPDEAVKVGERLARVRADRTQEEFARILGVADRTYWNYERGNRPPPSKVLSAIASLGWNPTWVLTGEGDERLALDADREAAGDFAGAVVGDPEAKARWGRHREVSSKAFGRGAKAALADYPADLGDYVFVPHLGVALAAGAGQVVESEQIVAWMAFRRSYLQMLGVAARAACLVRVKGDSMEADLRDGDSVLLDTSDTIPGAKKRAYAFRIQSTNELAVKYITLEHDGAWKLEGADHWTPVTLPKDAAKPLVIGRVRWSGRTWD